MTSSTELPAGLSDDEQAEWLERLCLETPRGSLVMLWFRDATVEHVHEIASRYFRIPEVTTSALLLLRP